MALESRYHPSRLEELRHRGVNPGRRIQRGRSQLKHRSDDSAVGEITGLPQVDRRLQRRGQIIGVGRREGVHARRASGALCRRGGRAPHLRLAGTRGRVRHACAAPGDPVGAARGGAEKDHERPEARGGVHAVVVSRIQNLRIVRRAERVVVGRGPARGSGRACVVAVGQDDGKTTLLGGLVSDRVGPEVVPDRLEIEQRVGERSVARRSQAVDGRLARARDRA